MQILLFHCVENTHTDIAILQLKYLQVTSQLVGRCRSHSQHKHMMLYFTNITSYTHTFHVFHYKIFQIPSINFMTLIGLINSINSFIRKYCLCVLMLWKVDICKPESKFLTYEFYKQNYLQVFWKRSFRHQRANDGFITTIFLGNVCLGCNSISKIQIQNYNQIPTKYYIFKHFNKIVNLTNFTGFTVETLQKILNCIIENVHNNPNSSFNGIKLYFDTFYMKISWDWYIFDDFND